MKTPTLAVIIAVRANDNVDIIERLKWKQIPTDEHVQVVLVDDGSAHADQLAALCKERGWKYKYLLTNDAPFSLARSRNVGIKEATADYVYFEDADFLHKTNFYERLLHVAGNLEESPFNFAAIPTLFLTKQASERLIDNIHVRPDFDHQIDQFIAKLPFINPDVPNDLCDSFAPVGSNILVRRDLCFHVGLFDEYFNSWGGEDRDFVFRLLEKNSFLVRPAMFGETKKWAIHRTNAYEGWRSIYRLHGDWMARIGIYAVHIHHPENGWKDPYARQANFSYAERKAKDIESGKHKAMPYEIPGAPLNIFIGRNPVFYNDEVMKAIGSVAIIDPDKNVPPEEFAQRVIERAPARVFFQNPYGNDWLLELWQHLRAADIVCTCAERGGLPWSIYFDDGGFCCASKSYERHLWQGSEPIDAREYVATLRATEQSLEPQGRTPIEDLSPSLVEGKKNVLVLLQSLTDATTRHFCAPLRDYDEFLSIIEDLDRTGEFNVLVKNHPLNKTNPIEGVGIDVGGFNIYDLYDVADIAVTLNSGAGMMALATGLPVVTMGSTFYAQDSLAMSAADLSSLIERIRNPIHEQEAVDRFYGFLVNDFYSFASWTYGQRDYSDKTRMSIMKEVRFKKIVVAGKATEIKRTVFDRRSLIMDPYAYHLYTSGQSVTSLKLPHLDEGHKAYRAGKYRTAAELYDAAARSKRLPQFLRLAAESYDRAGDSKIAVARLQEAVALAKNTKPIARRLREMQRPKLLRAILKPLERPYPIPTD